MSPQMDLKRQKRKVNVPRVNILGVDVDDVSEQEAVDAILRLSNDKRRHRYVATVNSEFVMLAYRNNDFKQIINQSDLSLPDGAGVVLAKLIMGGKEQNRVTGVDLIDRICSKSEVSPIRIGFLGGFHNVAEIVKKRQLEKFPKTNIVFAQEGNPTIGYDLKLRSEINSAKGIDVLFVAYGMGQQEFWIKRNIGDINVGLAIGVGGAFDYLAKTKLRAPKFMQKIGLEWLWRLVQEPSRAWRMRVLPLFAVLVLGQWFLQKRAKRF